MTDVLKKLGDKAKEVYSTLKSIPPSDSEAQGIAETQKQVDAISGEKQKPKETPEEKPTEQEKNNPLTRYGSRPGEKRLDTSYTDNTAVKAPVYDKGGDVSIEASKKLQSAGDSGIQSLVNAPDEEAPAKSTTSQKPAGGGLLQLGADKLAERKQSDIKQPGYMPLTSEQKTAGMPTPVAPDIAMSGTQLSTPVFDEGGDVDVNDGKHQVAVLQEGEKVLTPEEAAQYKAEHGEKEVKPPVEHVAAQPAAAQPADTLKLKPYGQVMEDKAKAKAAEQVNNPGVNSDLSNSVPNQLPEEVAQPKAEEKPKLTYGQLLSEKMGFIPPLKMDNVQTPKEFQHPAEQQVATSPLTKLGSPEAPAAPTSQGPMKPIAQPETAPTGKAAFQAKIKDYDTQYQQLLDKAAQTNDPQYTEQAARIKEAKLAYEKAHPWGSPESAHPGVLGKLGHIGEMVASRAPIVAPIAASIPGSEESRIREGAAAEGETKEANAENVVENKATAVKATTQPATPEQIQDYQNRVQSSGLTGKALETYMRVPPGTTSAELDKRFDEGYKLKDMDIHQQLAATAEQDRKDKAQVAQENHEEARQDKLSKAYYTYTTTDPKTGKATTHVTTGDKLDELPEDAQLLPVKDMSSLLGEARSMNAVQDSLNELHKDLHDHPEVFDNAVARGIVQTTTEQMNRASAGLLIAGTGGSVPIPSGFGDTINTYLQNHALDDKTAKAVKDYIADYKAAKDKALVVQMAMQNGKMGRGGQQAFESIINQFPGGSTPDNATALRQMAALQRTTSGLTSKYPDKYADFTKTEPYALEEKEPEGTAAGERKSTEHKAAAKPSAKTNNGYSPNNPFAPKQQP
jgi:hypothetical protein